MLILLTATYIFPVWLYGCHMMSHLPNTLPLWDVQPCPAKSLGCTGSSHPWGKVRTNRGTAGHVDADFGSLQGHERNSDFYQTWTDSESQYKKFRRTFWVDVRNTSFWWNRYCNLSKNISLQTGVALWLLPSNGSSAGRSREEIRARGADLRKSIDALSRWASLSAAWDCRIFSIFSGRQVESKHNTSILRYPACRTSGHSGAEGQALSGLAVIIKARCSLLLSTAFMMFTLCNIMFNVMCWHSTDVHCFRPY